jgi:hypothetical protein
MNNSVIPYKIDESVIRAYEKDGENWFVAKDVLDLLKLQRNSLSKIKDEWKDIVKIDTKGGKQGLLIINKQAYAKLYYTKQDTSKFNYLYLIELNKDVIKIGIAKNINKRLKRYETYFTTITNKYILKTPFAKNIENLVKKEYEQYAVQGKEYFNKNFDEVKEFIEERYGVINFNTSPLKE